MKIENLKPRSFEMDFQKNRWSENETYFSLNSLLNNKENVEFEAKRFWDGFSEKSLERKQSTFLIKFFIKM